MKGWVKMPIPKQIKDKERDKKQTKHKENKKSQGIVYQVIKLTDKLAH